LGQCQFDLSGAIAFTIPQPPGSAPPAWVGCGHHSSYCNQYLHRFSKIPAKNPCFCVRSAQLEAGVFGRFFENWRKALHYSALQALKTRLFL